MKEFGSKIMKGSKLLREECKLIPQYLEQNFLFSNEIDQSKINTSELIIEYNNEKIDKIKAIESLLEFEDELLEQNANKWIFNN